MKLLSDVEKELSAKIPRSVVSERQGPGGRSLSYLQTHMVIDKMNRVFGPLNWSSSTEEVRLVHSGELENNGRKKYTAHYLARVQIQVQAQGDDGKVYQTTHMGTGYGDGDDSTNLGKAHELAAKEAESDAFKRAAKNLGMSMGLALYDRDQVNIEDEPAGEPQRAAPTAALSPVVSNEIAPKEGTVSSINREQLNKNLANVARVLNETGKQPFTATKELMNSKYGTAIKEQLSDAQASELYETLKGLAG